MEDFNAISRRTFLASSAVAAAAGLAGCSSSSSDSGSSSGSSSSSSSSESSDSSILRINIASEPDTLDPALTLTTDGVCLDCHLFVGLYGYDENGDVVPRLSAGDPEVSDDGCTYTFSLIESQWSDGTEVTANDFVYAWNRVIDPDTASELSTVFSIVARNDDDTLACSAPDDYTLTVTLTSPCAYFLEMLCMIQFLPLQQEPIEEANPDGSNPGAWCQEAGFVSNGPFTLTSWTHDESMTFTRNEYYYDAENVVLENLEFMLSADDTATFAAYQAGDLDFADSIPTDELSSLMEEDNSELHIVDSLGTYYVAFNVESDFFEGMTADEAAEFRHAICLLIDRQYIVDTVGQSGQTPADSFLPIGLSDGNGGEYKTEDVSYYDATEDAVESNREEALEILTGLGYTFTDNGDGTYSCEPSITIPYLINEGTTHQGIAECIQQDLSLVGIDMTVETQDWNVFVDNVGDGNFTACRQTWSADYNDPINFLELFVSGESGITHLSAEPDNEWADYGWSAYDDLIDQINTTADFEARVDLCHEAEDLLFTTWSVVPIYYHNDVYMQKENVSGIYCNASALKFFMYASKE